MPIYVRCPKCRTDQKIREDHEDLQGRRRRELRCCHCNARIPRQGRKYKISVRRKGKSIVRYTTNLTVAKKIEAELLRLIEDPNLEYHRKGSQKLEDFIEKDFLPFAKQNYKESTYKAALSYLRKWIIPTLGRKSLYEIAPLHVQRLIKNMQEAGMKPRTVHHCLAILQIVLNCAKTWGKLPPGHANPVSEIKKPKYDNRRTRALTKEEVHLLLEELKKRSQITYELALMSISTGARFGEIARLTWADIDFARRLIVFRDTKNKKARVAPMIEPVYRLLSSKKRGNPQDLVFPGPKSGQAIKSPPKIFKKVVEALGFNEGIEDEKQKVCFHTLRHTFATWLGERGYSTSIIQTMMGHETPQMASHYTHISAQVQRKVAQEIEKEFFSEGDRLILIEDYRKPQEMVTGETN